jgi:hypothetical protein
MRRPSLIAASVRDGRLLAKNLAMEPADRKDTLVADRDEWQLTSAAQVTDFVTSRAQDGGDLAGRIRPGLDSSGH